MASLLLLFYFSFSIIAGRKNPLYYLFFPLALLQGSGAFITDEAVSFGGRFPLTVASTLMGDVIFCLFIIIALRIKPQYEIKDRFPGPKAFLFYLVFIIFVFVLFVLQGGDINEAFLVGRYFMYIPLYYLLWSRIFSSATRAQIIDFFKVIATINIISTILYILNSGQFINIFPQENIYSEIHTGDKYFFRDFSTIPILGNIIFCCSLLMFLRKEYILPKIIVYINFAIWPIAILYTFTRGLIFFLVIMIILALLSSLFLKTLSLSRKITSIIGTITVLIVGVLLLQLAFPSEYNYFMSRLETTQFEGFDEGNIKIRGDYWSTAYQILEDEGSVVFGSGFSKEYYQAMGEIGAWAGDSMWPTHLLHTGLFGVIFISGIMLFFVVDSAFQFYRVKSFFHQLCFILLASSVLLTFNSSGLNGSSLSMMMFGLYAVIRKNSLARLEDYSSNNLYSENTTSNLMHSH